MKKAVLDTNFILNSVKQKIDFFDDIRVMGFEVVIPEEVLTEIERLAEKGKKLHTRDNAKITLKVLENNDFKTMKLNSDNVDRALKELAKKNKNLIIATIDRDLKYKIKRPVMIIRGKKKLEVV